MFQGTKTRSIFHLFSCAMLEAALKRTKTLLGRSKDPSRRPRTPIGFGFGGNLGVTGSILGPKTAPRRDQDLPKSGPKHLPRRTWQPKTAKNLKNLENDPQKSMGYPSGPHFWSLHGCIWDHFGEDFGALLHLEFAPSLLRCCTIFVHFFQYF